MTDALKVDSKNLFYRLNKSTNTYEVVDAVSGVVLAVQKDLNENFLLGHYDKFIKANIDGKEVYIQPGMTVESVKLPVLSFSKPIADLIVQEITEGETSLKNACKKFGVQYSTIMKWAKSVPEFGEALEEARRLSAEMIHDDIMEKAREASKGMMTKGEIETTRLATDLLKWSAEKRDPNRFGNKQEKNAQGAVQIIIQTGITREEKVIEVKNETIKE